MPRKGIRSPRDDNLVSDLRESSLRGEPHGKKRNIGTVAAEGKKGGLSKLLFPSKGKGSLRHEGGDKLRSGEK